MEHPALMKLVELGREPDALEATIAYLTESLRFLKAREVVLICFPRQGADSLGSMLEQAVLRRGAEPILWEKDFRWKTLLWLAFSNRATTVIGPPLVVLGLVKIARFKGTPLYVRKVITAGYPCMDWMIEGIIKGFDCGTGGCFTPGGRLVSGFSCEKSRGVHLRDQEYGVDIVDENGKTLPAGEMGDMILYSKKDPTVRYPMGERGRLELTPCPCGCKSPRLMDMSPGKSTDPDLEPVGQHLQSWTSILDCRMKKGTYGLEMEVITFPGEKLPKLPSCAKLVVRPWEPDEDEPFYYVPGIEKG